MFINLLINKLISEIRILKSNLLIKIFFSVLIYILTDYFSSYKIFNSFNTWIKYYLLI